jgi:Holliday junction DNA helicase RuvA
MIGRLAGSLILKAEGLAVVDVGGVGYEVHVSGRTLAALPEPVAQVVLWTDLTVREDLLQLHGFPTREERDWHRLLVTVQGIGARGATAILDALGPRDLARAVAAGDWATLRAAPGIGAKLAQRVVLELRGRAPAMLALAGAEVPAPPPPGAAAPAGSPPPGSAAAAPSPASGAEALSALVHLGYAPGEAAAAVAAAAGANPGAATAELIRAALRRLAPAG